MAVAPTTWKLAGVNLAARVGALFERNTPDLAASLLTLRDGRLHTDRLAPPHAADRARQTLANRAPEAWSLVVEGSVDDGGLPVDAIVVEVGDAGGTARIALPYRIPASLLGIFGETTPEILAALREGAGPRAPAALAAALGGEPSGGDVLVSAWTADEVAGLPASAITALQRGYAVVLLAVAGADGQVDAQELAAYERWVAAAVRRPGPARALFPDPAVAQAHVTDLLAANTTATDAIFDTLAALGAHARRRAGRAYTGELRALARDVAEASGASLLTLWDPISAAEQRAIDRLDKLLATLYV